MTLDELQQQAEKDLKMDDLELADESLKSATLHQKYLNIYNNFRQLRLMNEGTYNVLKRKKWEYYGGKASPEVYRDNPFDHKVLKADLHIYMDSDPELQKADQKVAYLDQIIKYLEQVLRGVNNRTFLIKNAIEWKKFTSGAI